MNRNHAILVPILLTTLILPIAFAQTQNMGTLVLDLTLPTPVQNITALSFQEPVKAIKKVEIVRIDNGIETTVFTKDFEEYYLASSLTPQQNISLESGTYIIKVKYRGQKGKWILNGNGSGMS